MNTPIAVAISETRKNMIKVINESGLPASILEEITRSIFYEVAQKSKEELEESMESMKKESNIDG